MKDLTLITCSYNTPEMTITMLRSFLNVHPGQHQIIVMENSTNEDTVNLLKENNIPYIRTVGGSHGPSVDTALKACKTTYALLVDTDVIFLKNHEDIFKSFKDNDLTLMGKIEGDRGGKHIHNRVNPWHCFINVKNIRDNNISFIDVDRTKNSFGTSYIYDIGSTFFEDINNKKLKIGNVDLSNNYYVHYEGMSWYTNKYDPTKPDTGIDFGGTHNNTGLYNIGLQKYNILRKEIVKYMHIDPKDRFVDDRPRPTIGVAYNLFDGQENFEKSATSIRDNVDYITVVYQKRSNYFNDIDYNVDELLANMKKRGLIDSYIPYEPQVVSPHQNELNKRNIGLAHCRNIGCDYFISMDVDEIYDPNQFKAAIKTVIEGDYDSSACRLLTYYKTDEYIFDPPEEYYVSFLYKISDNMFQFAYPFPVTVDPTRRIPTQKCKIFDMKELCMNHFSYVRSDIRKKFNNSSAKVNYRDRIEIISKYHDEWKPGMPALIAGNPDVQWNLKHVGSKNPLFSIVMTYYNRKPQLVNTLSSIIISKYKNIEIIIVDDGSSPEHRLEDITELFPELRIKLIRLEPDKKWYCNPCIPYNIGFKQATGDIVVIQNPECIHIGDVLSYINENFKYGEYYTFGCYAITEEKTKKINLYKQDNIVEHLNNVINLSPMLAARRDHDNGWYNHTIHRPVGYHFLSCIRRKDLNDLGGFDERYAKGNGWDDNEFLARIQRRGLIIKLLDVPLCLHQWHPQFNYMGKIIYNKDFYENVTLKEYKWRVNTGT